MGQVVHELAMEDAIARHPRPKLETFGDALLMVVYSPIREDGRLTFAETQLFAGKGYVISARYGDSGCLATAGINRRALPWRGRQTR